MQGKTAGQADYVGESALAVATMRRFDQAACPWQHRPGQNFRCFAAR